MKKLNGEYGCMDDSGMHACHMPFGAGWVPKDVRAILSNIIKDRPDGNCGMVAFKSITGSIFEAGFSDSILQMWASFIYEIHHGKPVSKFAGCVKPQEVAQSHKLFTTGQ